MTHVCGKIQTQYHGRAPILSCLQNDHHDKIQIRNHDEAPILLVFRTRIQWLNVFLIYKPNR